MEKAVILQQEHRLGRRLSAERRYYNHRLAGGGSKQVQFKRKSMNVTWDSANFGKHGQARTAMEFTDGAWTSVTFDESESGDEFEDMGEQQRTIDEEEVADNKTFWPDVAYLATALNAKPGEPLWTPNNIRIKDNAPVLGPWISVPQLLGLSKPVVSL
jgi:hypothetical protein